MRRLWLQMFTNANASMVTGDEFPNTLSQWCFLFMCREAVQSDVFATPQGGVIRASPAEAFFLQAVNRVGEIHYLITFTLGLLVLN